MPVYHLEKNFNNLRNFGKIQTGIKNSKIVLFGDVDKMLVYYTNENHW